MVFVVLDCQKMHTVGFEVGYQNSPVEVQKMNFVVSLKTCYFGDRLPLNFGDHEPWNFVDHVPLNFVDVRWLRRSFVVDCLHQSCAGQIAGLEVYCSDLAGVGLVRAVVVCSFGGVEKKIVIELDQVAFS